MIKKILQFTFRNMNKKTKETITEKLNNKKICKPLMKFDESSTLIVKSELFNKTKSKKNLKNETKTFVPSDDSEKPDSSSRLRIGTRKNAAKLEVANKSEIKIEKLANEAVKVEKAKSKKKAVPLKSEEEPSCSKKIKQELPSATDKWEPKNWSTILENIRQMRSKDNAPVDTMGCHKCADENADEKTQRYHKLIALMLSSQTKDETTYHAMLRLREQNLTPETIVSMKQNVLENILHPVSFYKNKAKYLQQTSQILIEKYHSDIPSNIKELVALPGVGPKMAHICMATAWKQVTGIGVDVHVHRICNRLSWMPKPTNEPEQTRQALEEWLPISLWSEVNHLLVGFGQTTCTPVKPKCLECLNFEICPAAKKNVGKKADAKLLQLAEKSKFTKTKMHL